VSLYEIQLHDMFGVAVSSKVLATVYGCVLIYAHTTRFARLASLLLQLLHLLRGSLPLQVL
jgi:hypothetical protein